MIKKLMIKIIVIKITETEVRKKLEHLVTSTFSQIMLEGLSALPDVQIYFDDLKYNQG